MSNRKHPAAAVLIILSALVVISAAVFAFGTYVSGLETIFPNVSINGFDLGGMTKSEASAALLESGFVSESDETVKLEFTGGVKLELSRSEAGLITTADDAIGLAYEQGRSGGFFSRTLGYLKCMMLDTDIDTGDIKNSIKEDKVRGIVSEVVKNVNSKVIDSAFSVSGDRLTITKGVSAVTVYEEDVFDAVVGAFETGSYELIKFEPADAVVQDIDIDAVYEAVYSDPVSAVYDKESDSVTESSTGFTFNRAEARRLYNAAGLGESISVALTVIEPEISKAELEMLIFRDVLSEKSTSMSTSSAERINNIALAAKAINGTVLMPGDEFSFNGIVGKRTVEKGYQGAGAYVGGETVIEIGGGICQVSSTIYYCALLTDLNITSRYNHMYAVSYLPLGMDATVNWGTIDFKLENNREYPIKILSHVENKKLYVQMLGTKTDDINIKLTYELLSSTPFETVEKLDDTLKPGERVVKTSGYTGFVVNAYMKKYDISGELIDTLFISKNTYKKRDEVILVGPEEPSPSPVEPSPSPTPEDGGEGTPAEIEVSPDPSPDVSPDQ